MKVTVGYFATIVSTASRALVGDAVGALHRHQLRPHGGEGRGELDVGNGDHVAGGDGAPRFERRLRLVLDDGHDPQLPTRDRHGRVDVQAALPRQG
ncbi:hypothetical protein [Micromonospora sp. NPDC049679]|uniref:hypothetical protein n=1 Tax=Micromonospora sp. NPDC049679 TaxID=3155920 RepID=UPI0033FAEC3B